MVVVNILIQLTFRCHWYQTNDCTMSRIETEIRFLLICHGMKDTGKIMMIIMAM